MKWLLLDFRHSGAAADYTLVFGPNVAPHKLERKSTRRPRSANWSSLMPEDANMPRPWPDWRAKKAARCAAAGVAGGPLGDSTFSWEARVHVYAGLPWARVLLTFGHDVSTRNLPPCAAWLGVCRRCAARPVCPPTD